MYCLNCGTKISDDELQCPNCGSSVASMKERIAKAEEMVAYTDAVDPSVTSKMPLVSERSYTDKDGNPLDPSKEVDVEKLKTNEADLRAIPEIGDDDPYVTKPMQKSFPILARLLLMWTGSQNLICKMYQKLKFGIG